MSLTTNDVRVLRLLSEHGPHTKFEIAAALCHGLGAEPALRRLQPLLDRQMIGRDQAPEGPADLYDATAEGMRALRAADRAAYGRFT